MRVYGELENGRCQCPLPVVVKLCWSGVIGFGDHRRGGDGLPRFWAAAQAGFQMHQVVVQKFYQQVGIGGGEFELLHATRLR